MEINVKIINGFSMNGSGGNPAGVVFDADVLTNHQKQAIARQVGMSETAFLSRSAEADYRFEFFTPDKQIPHCGHATIAAFSFLKQTGRLKASVSSKETIDGIRDIYLVGDEAYMEQRPPTFLKPDEGDFKTIYKSLGISEQDLLNDHTPIIGNTGNSFLLVGVKDQEILKNLKPDQNVIYELSAKYNLIGFYIFAEGEKVDATTRMFGPYYGIPEEAATGMAAGPLAAYLFSCEGSRKKEYLIEQGVFMEQPSPSLLKIKLERDAGDKMNRVLVGGSGHFVKEMIVKA